MLYFFFTSAASLYINRDMLQSPKPGADVEVMYVKLSVSGYWFFKKDRTDGNKDGGGAVINTILAVPHPQPHISINGVQTCYISPPESHLILIFFLASSA